MEEQMEGQAVPEERKSSIWKLSTVLFDPKKGFAEIREKPNWLLPLLLTIVLAFVAYGAIVQTIGADELATQQLAAGGADMSQMSDEQFEMTKKITVYAPFIAIPIVFPLMCLAIAGVFLLAYTLLGGENKYRRVFSVVAHTFLVQQLISFVLLLVVLAVGNPENFDMQNPLATNLGVFFDRHESPAGFAFASSLDILSIYFVILAGMGLAITGRSKTLGKGVAATMIPWILMIAVKVGFRLIFPGN